MLRMDPARFEELVRRRNAALVVFEHAQEILIAANETTLQAGLKHRTAELNLSDYVSECAGDPKPKRRK